MLAADDYSLKFKWPLRAFGLLVLCLQFFSLPYQPLPWFDEVFFASLGDNFWRNGLFNVPVTVMQTPVPLYGWVYPLVLGAFQELFGHSALAVRVFTFACGLIFLLVFYHFFRKKPFSILFVLLLASDPFFSLSWHEGRMDIVALLFCFGCLVLIIYYLQTQSEAFYWRILYGLGSAFLGALALQTTPRSAFLLLGFGFCFLYSFPKNLMAGLFWFLLLSMFYSLWLFFYFKSFGHFWNYYTDSTAIMQQGSSYLTWFVGGEFYVPKQEYLLVSLVILLACLCLWWNKKCVFMALRQFHLSLEVVISLSFVLNLLLFYVLVKDYGPYSVFVLPFWYALLAFLMQKLNFLSQKLEQRLRWGIFAALFLHNVGVLGLKTLQLAASWELRQPDVAQNWLKKHIPKSSRVVGCPLFYYAARQNAHQYQLCTYYQTKPERLKYQLNQFNFDYLIISDHTALYQADVAQFYLNNSPLEKVSRLELKPVAGSDWLLKHIPLSKTENNGYNATLYRRVR